MEGGRESNSRFIAVKMHPLNPFITLKIQPSVLNRKELAISAPAGVFSNG